MTEEQDFDLEEVAPGVRTTVSWLISNGFDTVDSNDGSCPNSENHICENPLVVIQVEAKDLITETQRLYDLLVQRRIRIEPQIGDDEGRVAIQASFDPADGSSMILLIGLNDTIFSSTTAQS